MTEERIDIIIEDKISATVGTKIKAIADAAREAHLALNEVKSAMAALGITKLGGLSTATQQATQANREAAKATRDLNAATKEQAAAAASAQIGLGKMEREAQALRRSLTPLAAEMVTLNNQMQTANRLQAQGVITAAEHGAMTQALTQRIAQNQQAQAKANAVMTLGGSASRSFRQDLWRQQNIIYQLNDTIVGAASGQKAFTIAMQQGSQVMQMYMGAGRGMGGMFKAMWQDLKPMLAGLARFAANPIVLVILATAAAFVAMANSMKEAFNVGRSGDAKFTFLEVARATIIVLTRETIAYGKELVKAFEDANPAVMVFADNVANWVGNAFDTVLAKANAFKNWFNEQDFQLTKFMLQQGLPTTIKSPTKREAILNSSSYADYQVATQSKEKRALEDKAEATRKLKRTEDIRAEAAKIHAANDKKAQQDAVDHAKELQKGIEDLYASTQKDVLAAGMDDYDRALVEVNAKIAELIRHHGALNAEQAKMAQNTRDLALQAVAYKKLHDLIVETRTPSEQLAHQLQEVNKTAMWAKTPEQIEAVRRKIQQLTDDANPMVDTFKTAASGIKDAFTTMFENMLSKGKFSWKNMATDFLQVFKRMLAQMATLAIAAPVIVPVLNSVGSSLGLSQGTISNTANGLGLGTIASASGAGISAASSGLTAPILSGSGFWTGMDALTGIGVGANTSATMLRGFTPGSTLAGIGGGLLANAFGLGGGVGGTIGGGVGGIAGTAVGSLVGMPMLGSAVGSFLGTALGGLFGGGKPSDKGQNAQIDLASGQILSRGGLSGKKFSQENYDAVTGFSQLFGTVSKLLDATGKLTLIVGSRDGLRADYNGTGQVRYNDPGAFIKGVLNTINNGAPKVNESLKIALEHIDFSKVKDNMNDILKDIDFALAFDTLGDKKEEVTATKTAWDSLLETFKEAQATAVRLGLSEQKVTDMREKAIKILVQSFETEQRNAMLTGVIPAFGDFLSVIQEREAALKDAAMIGADTALVQLRYQKAIDALIVSNGAAQQDVLTAEQERLTTAQSLANQYSKIVSNFDDILYRLRYGDMTANNPVANLNDMRDLVSTLSGKARLGDASAADQLAQVLPDFVKLSEEVNGANAKYADDLKLATQIATDTRSVAQRQFEVQTRIANSSQQQVDLLQKLVDTGNLVKDQRYITGDFSSAKIADSNPNKIAVRAMQAGKIDQTQYEAIVRAAGFYGVFGANRANQFFVDNPGAAATLTSMLRSGGLAGYATGGYVTGGVAGRDSVPIMAMPNEYIMTSKAAAGIGPAALNYMNRTGMLPPSNDNTALAGGIVNLTNQVQGLINVVAAMGERMTALQERTAEAGESLASESRLQKWA